MPTYTLRPISYYGGSPYTSWGNVASNAALATALGDNSDATFATRSGASGLGTTQPIFNLSAPSIGSGEFIVRAGHFVRWKGGGGTGNTNENLGAVAFRTTDPTPYQSQTLITDGRATASTTEVGYSIVSWSVAEVSTLRVMLNSNNRILSTAPTTTVYEVGATLYTLNAPSVTVSNQTITTNAKPTIAVSLTMTIGWESAVPETSNLRRAVTEVRIESGGTGVGTGTLVGYAYTDTFNAQTGTTNVFVDSVIANGTYNLYARSTRFREGQTVDQAIASTGQSSAWASATLTMNNSVPTAPSLFTFGDSSLKRIGIGVTPVATSGVYAPATIDIERSTNGGITWSAIRLSPLTVRQNLINNPSFETDTTGWTANANTTLSRTTGFFSSGTASANLVAIAAGTVGITSTTSTLGAAIVSPNLSYSASAYLRSTAASRNGVISIVWLTTAGTTISTSAGASTALTSGSFIRISVTATAPSNAAFAYLTITSPSTFNIGESIYIDAILLEQSASVGGYLDFIATATVYDYEMPRGTSISYRSRVNAYSVGYPTSSPYSSSSSSSIPVNAEWALKAPLTPTLNVSTLEVVDTPTEELTEDLGVFRPLDRRYPVVVAGQLGGYDGTLCIYTTTSAEWTSVKALLESQQVLYLESGFGWSKYIRLVSGARVEIMGTTNAPRRKIEVSYVEVSAP